MATYTNKKTGEILTEEQFFARYPNMAPTQPPKGPDTSFRDIPGNILPSTGKAIKGIVSTVAHPIATTKAIGSIAIGGASKLGRALGTGANVGKKSTKEEKSFDSFVDFFKNRYGSTQKLKETIINDPAGFALDLSSLIAGGSSLAKTAGLTKTSNVLSKTARVANPINVAAKGTSKVGSGIKSGAGTLSSEILGFTTGAGAEVIKEAFRNPSDDFTAALRGKTSKMELVELAKSGLDRVRDKRSADYRAQLESIGSQKKSLDISPLFKSLDKQLKRYNVQQKDGTYDFSRSTISEPAEIQRVQGVIDTLKDWGTQPGDRTPIGLDLLKRRLDDFYSPSNASRAFVAEIRNDVKSILVKNVPEYNKMTSGYAQATHFIEDVESALSLAGGRAKETAINKLTQGLQQNREFRTSVIKELESITGQEITPQIAGAALESWLPRGLVSRLVASGGIGGAIFTPKLIIALASLLPTFSPRVVGEIVRAMGISASKVDDVTNAIMRIREKVPGIRGMSASELEQAIFEGAQLRISTEPAEEPIE